MATSVQQTEQEDVVDLFFPDEVTLDFGNDILDCIRDKGYCSIAMPEFSESERAAAVSKAQRDSRQYKMKREVEVGYLGYDSNTKLALRKSDSPDLQPSDTLSHCDRCLTHIAVLLSELSSDALGLSCKRRTNAFVRTSHDNAFEATDLDLDSVLDAQDPDDWKDDIFRFVNFSQTRVLSMLYMIQNAGGDVWLYPRDGKNTSSVKIPVAPNKLVIFRHDSAEYSYQPFGRSVALQAWMLKEKSDLKHIHAVDFKVDERLAVVNPGHKEPEGPPAHVSAMHVRMPGEVEGGDQWWNVFVAGLDGVVQWPVGRWSTDLYYHEGETMPGKSYTKHGGFTSEDQTYSFDNDFFGIDEEEAKTMILSHRWMPEVGYICLMNAGYNEKSLVGAPIGTWVGDVGPDWGVFVSEWARFCPNATGPQMARNTHVHVAAARLSYTFGFTGPVSSFDTACSSSLVAMNAAHTFMFANDPPGQESSKALVMGVNTLLGPDSYIGNCAAGMLTHDGRCFTFNRAADGYQRGEGCGAMFLDTQLTELEKKKSLGCVVGTATNQDGRSASITAPNGPAQTSVILKSMRFGGIDVNVVAMAECHGTGTGLGDPIEVGALQAVMKKRVIPMFSVSTKSHIGHLEAGAGIAGVTKCIEMIRASCGPPNCHFNFLNANIDVSGYPVFFDTEILDSGFSSGYCGVSSFGFGGTNSRCDVYSECSRGSRAKSHVELPPPAVPRRTFTKADEISVVSTTTGWSVPESMETDEDNGSHFFFLTLGETCVESFRLVLGENKEHFLYPAVHNANEDAQVMGPDHLHDGRCWTIDGRKDGVPAGTVYQITFEWGDGIKQIWWGPTDEPIEDVEENSNHTYYCLGSFNEWNMQLMKPVPGTTDTVELTFRIGPHEQEEFQLVRDNDMRQVFFPSDDDAVGGPQPMGHRILDKKFCVRSKQCDKVRLRFTIKNGSFTVVAATPAGDITWRSTSSLTVLDA